MGRIWGNLAVGFAVGALIAAVPALADTDTFNTSGTVATQITDNTTDSTATSVVVTGASTVALTNATNTYTGGTTVNGGSTLVVTVDGNLGAAAGSVTLGDATVPTAGATAANLGTLDLTQSTAAVTSARGIVLDAGGGTIIAGASPWTLSGAISGAGLLTVAGNSPTSTLILSGTNTFTGGVAIIDGATLKVSASTNLSSGTITFGPASGGTANNGTLDLTGSTAAETAANAIVLNAGGGTIITGPDAWTLSGVISGAGGLTVTGTGTLIQTGTNTYTGGTTIAGGATVQISADAALGATTGGVTLGNATSLGTLNLSSTGAVTSALSIKLGAGGGIIDVTGHAWTISNPISGAGGLTLNGTANGTGTLILDGANTYTGATTITAGTLQLGDAIGTTASLAGGVSVASAAALTGFGTIAGAVANSGFIAPGITGKVGTLTVGSYNQSTSGTLSFLVTPTGASELKVGGIADLAGTLHLDLQGQLGTKTYTLITAGTINGTFATVTDTVSAALSAQISYATPDEVNLILTQLTTLPENPTIFGDVESAAIDGGQAANTTLLSHLTGIRTGAAVDQMTMVNTSDHRAGASVGSSPYGAWAQGQGGFGSVNGSGSAPSYNVHGGGFMAGADAQVGRGGVLGAAFGYDITSLSESGGASASIDTPRVAVYGGYWWGPIAFDATAGIGLPSITSDRPVTQTGTTAAASYNGNEITAAFQASSTISLGDYAITPAIGTQYTRLNLHGLSESGAAGFDLDAPSSTTNSLRPFIAATASTRFFLDVRTVLEPTLRVAYSEEALSNSRQVAIIPSGDNMTFEVDGAKPSRGEASLDAGLVLETSHDLGFYTNAAVDGLGNSSGVKLDAGVRYRF